MIRMVPQAIPFSLIAKAKVRVPAPRVAATKEKTDEVGPPGRKRALFIFS